MSRTAKRLIDKLVVPACRRVGALKSLATYVGMSVSDDGYPQLRARFIENGSVSKFSGAARAELIRKFEAIDQGIGIASTPAEGLILAEALLSLDASGDVVECGCFEGGSTAKLSLVAKLTGRKLLVYDSFEGLPTVDDNNRHDFNARWGKEFVTEWTAGRYAARLDFVKDNVNRFGELSVCSFNKGWFSDTLKPGCLTASVALAFVDVDIPNSARECLSGIWPQLSDRGVFFLHDIGFIKLLQAVTSEELWSGEFKSYPPVLFGAGYGMGDEAPYLGFFVKGRGIPAEYINNLTIKK